MKQKTLSTRTQDLMKKEINEKDSLDKEFDFSHAVRNPYAKVLKQQITIKLAPDTIQYFKDEAVAVGIPYQTLINLYLDDCVTHKRKLEMSWH